MTRAELAETVKNGENSGVEFKRDTIDNRAFAKGLVAFTNFQGGRLLLGVDNDGTMLGLTRNNLEEWVMTACRDKIRPETSLPYNPPPQPVPVIPGPRADSSETGRRFQLLAEADGRKTPP